MADADPVKPTFTPAVGGVPAVPRVLHRPGHGPVAQGQAEGGTRGAVRARTRLFGSLGRDTRPASPNGRGEGEDGGPATPASTRQNPALARTEDSGIPRSHDGVADAPPLALSRAHGPSPGVSASATATAEIPSERQRQFKGSDRVRQPSRRPIDRPTKAEQPAITTNGHSRLAWPAPRNRPVDRR